MVEIHAHSRHNVPRGTCYRREGALGACLPLPQASQSPNNAHRRISAGRARPSRDWSLRFSKLLPSLLGCEAHRGSRTFLTKCVIRTCHAWAQHRRCPYAHYPSERGFPPADWERIALDRASSTTCELRDEGRDAGFGPWRTSLWTSPRARAARCGGGKRGGTWAGGVPSREGSLTAP